MSKILITGTSKGIGYETALMFARAGHQVFATMRNPAQSDLGKVAAKENLPIAISVLDVDSDKLNDFDEVDKKYLEQVASSISQLI